MNNPLDRFDQPTARIVVLGAVTFVMFFAAVVMVFAEASRVQPAIEPTLMFPNLDVTTTARLTIESRDGTIEISRASNGDWVVPSRNGYPARNGPRVQTIGGLAELELLEPKTARDDWHHFLDLEDPSDGGAGVEITVQDAQGNELAAVIVGNQPLGNAAELDGRERIHVRRPDETQTWLARGSLSLHTDITEWLRLRLYNIAGERIHEARVTTPGGSTYTLRRAEQGAETFDLLELPVGREILSPYVLESVGTSLSDMEAEDARAATEVNLEGGFEVVYITFDGLEVTFRVANPDGEDAGWATILARFTGIPNAEPREAAAVAEEAANINRLTDGWAFQLPRFQARQMTLELDDLLRPLPEPGGSAN